MATEKKPRPVTDFDRQEVRRLATEENLGRNEIARRLNRSPRTISEIAAALDPPVTFDRTMTAVATQARVIDAKARRAEIIQRLYARVEATLTRLEEASHGGFKYTTSTGQGIDTVSLDHVPGQEEKALAAAIGQYLTHATRLEQLDGDPGIEAARSMLGALAEGLNQLADRAGKDDRGEG